MKKIYYIILFVVIFSFKNVLAIDSCTSSKMQNLKEIANNVQFKTSHEIVSVDEENESVDISYNIEAINLNNDIKVYYKDVDEDDNEVMTTVESKLEGFMEGTKVQFYIRSYTNDLCTDTLLKTVTVTLPSYNDYYYFNKDKCEKHPDFKYCKEFMDVSDLEFAEIDQMYEEYTNPVNIVTNNIKNHSLGYIIGGISAGVVLLIAILIIIINKKRHKKDEL